MVLDLLSLLCLASALLLTVRAAIAAFVTTERTPHEPAHTGRHLCSPACEYDAQRNFKAVLQ